MNALGYNALQKELKKGQIDACIIRQHENISFEFYKNKKTLTCMVDII